MRLCSPAPRGPRSFLQVPYDPGTRCVSVSGSEDLTGIPHHPQDVKVTNEVQGPRPRLLAESPSEPRAGQGSLTLLQRGN